MAKHRKKYSLEFKTFAVSLIELYGVSAAAQELNISKHNLNHWKRAFNGKLSKRPDAVIISKRTVSLQKELSDIRTERDILKKAHGIFTKIDGQNINLSKTILRYFLL